MIGRDSGVFRNDSRAFWCHLAVLVHRTCGRPSAGEKSLLLWLNRICEVDVVGRLAEFAEEGSQVQVRICEEQGYSWESTCAACWVDARHACEDCVRNCEGGFGQWYAHLRKCGRTYITSNAASVAQVQGKAEGKQLAEARFWTAEAGSQM